MLARVDKTWFIRMAVMVILVGLASVGWAGLAQSLSGDWKTDDEAGYEDVPAESTEEGLEFETPFMVDVTHLLLGIVGDCGTGEEIDPALLHTSFVFDLKASFPYGLDDLLTITLESPGYIPIEISGFQPVTFSLLFFDITFLTVTDPRICLQALPGVVIADGVLLSHVEWRQTRRLTWDDFQVKENRPAGVDESAQIFSGLDLGWRSAPATQSGSGHVARIQTSSLVVRNVMVQTGSWVVAGTQTDSLLNHEQRHFDLNEVYRRKLQAALLKLRGEGKTAKEAHEDLERKINETWKKAMDKLNGISAVGGADRVDGLQDDYDNQTEHGTEAGKQEEWDKKIDEWLKDPSKAPDW
ncbi:MAG: hypothetical protein E4H08_10290 [Candidatus Atribacteria bacterium]|nr:MAG: hypothetical protein E4H08_10290 [Candidatus Atribacteria bacterium]